MRDLVAVPRLFGIWLNDAYTKDSVNFRAPGNYNLLINKSDSSTFGPKRLLLVIRQNAELAYRLISFTATKATPASGVRINWQTVNEANYTRFTVERSTDAGATFAVLAAAEADGSGSYSEVDNSPVQGENIYRLKQEDLNSMISYSKRVTVAYAQESGQLAGGNISIFPNPVTSILHLSVLATQGNWGSYQIEMPNSSGLVVKKFVCGQPSWQGSAAELHTGTYFISVFNPKDHSVIGHSKFIKL